MGKRTVGEGRAATHLAEHKAAQQGCKEPSAPGKDPHEGPIEKRRIQDRGHLRAWVEMEGPRLRTVVKVSGARSEGATTHKAGHVRTGGESHERK